MPESIVERIGELRLPEERYVVIGSGVMDALGLRPARDIDLVVAPDHFDALKTDDGWTSAVRHDEEVLEKDDVEVWLSWGSDSTPNFDELYDESVVIDGVRFARPEFVLDWKRKHPSEKNDRDIALLEEYMRMHG